MFWIIVAIIVVVLLCSLSSSSESNADAQKQLAEAQQKQLADQSSARRPEALRRLFDEEFPEYSGQLTYAKAERFISRWDEVIASSEYKQAFSWMNGAPKSPAAEQQAQRLLVGEVAAVVSPQFRDSAVSTAAVSQQTFQMIINSSHTLAQGE